MNMTDNKKATDFVAALTIISAKYGVGITGAPVLFMMEHEDYERSYRMDDASALIFE